MFSQRTPARPKATTVLLVLLISATTLALLPGAASTSATAVTKSDVRVTRVVSAGSVLTGDPLTVSGRVSPAPTSATVALQRYVNGRWRSVKFGRVAADDTYRFSIATRVAGSPRFRVYSPADARRREAASSAFRVNILACLTTDAPASGVRAWFTRPGLQAASQLSQQLGRLFCSAAPRSTVNVSMYFINAAGGEPDMDQILQPLERVVRYRGVKVRIMLEGKLYGTGAPLAGTLGVLKRFATVVLCNHGCLNERASDASGHGILHHKFVTVSDMSWGRGVDPAVVVSSANLSRSQLHNFWQSAVLIYNDKTLSREFDIESAKMLACARAGCASWAARMTKLALAPETYGLTNSTGLWHDTVPGERRGSFGTGRGITFSPWFGRDPLATSLRGYTCTAGHDVVRVSHMFVTAARQSVIDALAGLQARGCRVRVILRKLTDTPLQAGVGLLEKAGLRVSCVPRVHNKYILVNAVRTSDGRPDRALWVGSQSLGSRALKSNDETLLRISTAESSATAATANSALWGTFNRNWASMLQYQQSCA